uniref:Stress-associated endoplasmic reticulum protein n=1 Tax=Callorhinchus milii TaxID=7868 RepID=A0A4W3HPA8_CALMI
MSETCHSEQRIYMVNEKHSKNITQRGNVAHSTRPLQEEKALVASWLQTLCLWCVAHYASNQRIQYGM